MNNKLLAPPLYDYMYHEDAILFFILDQDGYVLDNNQYAKKMVGSNLLALKKHLYDILVNVDNLPPFSKLIKDLNAPKLLNIKKYNNTPQTYYFRFYKEGNQIFAFGQADHIEIETMRDNIIKANQEINNLARDLHKKNAQLIQLNNQKNQFLGMAAHDLRNPIGAIQSCSQLLFEETTDVLNKADIELLKAIVDTSKFMFQLLNNLLDISKIEAGKLELTLSAIDVVPFIERNVSLNQMLAEKKQIKLVFRGADNIPAIKIDPTKIEQVLNNLISNAIKYSFPNTTIQICVSQQENSILISVQDEGQGIPENEMSKLFQSFQTTSVQSTSNEKSTGLGLFISKKIVSGHGGKIWGESEQGKGSTFYFTLPLV